MFSDLLSRMIEGKLGRRTKSVIIVAHQMVDRAIFDSCTSYFVCRTVRKVPILLFLSPTTMLASQETIVRSCGTQHVGGVYLTPHVASTSLLPDHLRNSHSDGETVLREKLLI